MHGMRIGALVCLVSLALCPSVVTAALVTGDVGSVSSQIKIPAADAVAANTSFLQSIEPMKAAGLGVAGATGGLTHPACIAETQARAARKQPPPAGDFPCIVPAGTGIVDGVCFVNVCKGITSTGLDGIMSALKSIGSLGGIVSGILSKLLQGGSSAPDGPTPTPSETIPPVSTPLTSGLISSDTTTYPSIDMTALFTHSKSVVQELLSALSPQANEQTSVTR